MAQTSLYHRNLQKGLMKKKLESLLAILTANNQVKAKVVSLVTLSKVCKISCLVQTPRDNKQNLVLKKASKELMLSKQLKISKKTF